ncbi:postacrosomal sheath WW domain-binding protein isoform X2 [Arvicanthis niloticus]|uniref:postacrosomal sheath WW domain-binding protein isoform X2 n=1 Tax=Arvicanthis niloticus TaxID=61156 RepID=UPI001486CFD6|nr:postacrosomal sheath WW domain-binding protein [Arvicanthis niloticus]
MAVNQNHTVDRRGAAIPHGESLLKKCSDVDLSFPQSPPGSTLFSGTKRGALFLTSYRVIFVTSRSDSDSMLSFTMPFHLMSNCTVEQPIFGANYIKGTIQAALDGGWEGSATFKIVFRKGGALDFAQLMAKAASAAAQGFPLRVASFWMGPLGIYVITGDRSMYAPQAYQVAYGALPAGYGAPPAGYGAPPAGYGTPSAAYGAPPAGYGAPPPRYDVLPPGYGAVRYGSPPPLYVATPMGYGVPPPGYGPPPVRYGSPPPGYEAPAVEYGAQPPRYVTTPMGSGSPPPGYEALPMGYGTPPSGRESQPPGSTALSVAQEAPPAGSEAGHSTSVAAQNPEFQASFPSASTSQAHSPPSKM